MERFKPEEGQRYWYVSIENVAISSPSWNGDDHVDQFRYKTGNCFATKEQAEAHRDALMRIAAGRAVVVDVPEGWEVDKEWGVDGQLGLCGLGGEEKRALIRVVVKPTPPPPPKEITVRVYDVEVHGDPIHGRLYVYVGKGLYIYPNEAEGL